MTVGKLKELFPVADTCEIDPGKLHVIRINTVELSGESLAKMAHNFNTVLGKHKIHAIVLVGDSQIFQVDPIDSRSYCVTMDEISDKPDHRLPSGYAYEYSDGVIRFSVDANPVNGAEPVKIIPFYFGKDVKPYQKGK